MDVDSSFNETVTEEEDLSIAGVIQRRKTQREINQVTANFNNQLQVVTMPNPAPPVRYDQQNEADEADVYTKISTLSLKFEKDDPKYWFKYFERQIKHFGVKSQTTKLEALINMLTKEVADEVKSFLRLDDDEWGTPHILISKLNFYQSISRDQRIISLKLLQEC